MRNARPAAGRVALLVLLPALAALGGCSDPSAPEGSEDSFLRHNQALWTRAAIRDYRYTVRNVCNCGPETVGPVRVEVRDGATVSVTAVESGRAIVPGAFDGLDTVEDLFATIRAALDERPDMVAVRYDTTRGFPDAFLVDPAWNAADDERGFAVGDFEPLP